MESNKLPDDELPVQLLESISNESKEVAKEKCRDRVWSYTKGYEDGYFIGATSYVEWKVKYDELKAENEQLRRWKAEALMLLSLVDAYADKHPEIKLGQGKVEFTIARAKERDTLKERCEKMEADYNNQRLINYNLKVVLGAIAMQKTCEEQENDPEAIEGSDGSKLGDIEYAYDHIITDAREALKEGESNTPAPGEGGGYLTREALEKELWVMLPDDCRAILAPLKKSYIESLMADIDSYCEGIKKQQA